MYNDKEKVFKLIVYNIFTSSHYQKKYTSNYVKTFFPYLDQMRKLSLFADIGHRIFKVLKNQMLMSQYIDNEYGPGMYDRNNIVNTSISSSDEESKSSSDLN